MQRRQSIARYMALGAILLLWGCGRQREYPWEIGAENQLAITDQQASLTLVEGTLTDTGGRFLLTNQGEKVFHYGQSLELQPRIGGKWYTVQGVQLDFVAIAFDLGPGESVTLDIDWTAYYGSLPPGEYRLIKDVSPDDDPIQNRVYFAAAEFEIQ